MAERTYLLRVTVYEPGEAQKETPQEFADNVAFSLMDTWRFHSWTRGVFL